MRFTRLILALLLAPAALGAQLAPSRQADTAAAPSDSVPVPAVDSASPRVAVLAFLVAGRAGDWERASRWLDQSYPENAARAPELARRLKAVLDSRLWVELERLSPLAEGDTADGLPRDREQLGTVQMRDGRERAVRLARVAVDGEQRWVFSPATVNWVDEVYADLPDSWIREHLPAPLLAIGPFEVLYWQWLALLILVPTAFTIGLTMGPITRAALRKLTSRTPTEYDDMLVSSARGPITLIWSVAAARVLLQWIALAAPVQRVVVEMQKALVVAAVYWMLLRAIGVLQEALPRAKWTETNPALRSLIPLGGRIARLLVFAAAVLTIISLFGYPIATILAGLGIGGIAIALGAQKSLEHFFGSVSLGVDQPFRVGDWINAGGTMGSVEAIGLRSTRIRTVDRTVVTIPNGQLAESRTENFGERERIRLAGTIGVQYGTSAATMRLLRDGIERILRAHPLTWQERVQVAFSNFGAYSLDIEFFCWLQTTAIDEFRTARHDLFLEIMEFVEGNGASFAFPTQTVHVVRGDGGPELGR